MTLAGKFLIKELESVWLGGETITAASAGTVVAIKALIRDSDSDILFATGVDIPADTTAGYAKACVFINTAIETGTTGLYCNKGTNLSCVFTAITQA